MSWTRCHAELALLHAKDLTIYRRFCRHNRFYRERWRRLQDIESADCYHWFGLNTQDFKRLFLLWRIPVVLRSPSGYVLDGEECFIIYMYHMNQGTPFTSMARHTFEGDPWRLSPMFETMVDHIYFTFYNKILDTSLDEWIPRYVHRCREIGHDTLSDGAMFERQYIDGKLVDEAWIVHHFDFDTF